MAAKASIVTEWVQTLPPNRFQIVGISCSTYRFSAACPKTQRYDLMQSDNVSVQLGNSRFDIHQQLETQMDFIHKIDALQYFKTRWGELHIS